MPGKWRAKWAKCFELNPVGRFGLRRPATRVVAPGVKLQNHAAPRATVSPAAPRARKRTLSCREGRRRTGVSAEPGRRGLLTHIRAESAARRASPPPHGRERLKSARRGSPTFFLPPRPRPKVVFCKKRNCVVLPSSLWIAADCPALTF